MYTTKLLNWCNDNNVQEFRKLLQLTDWSNEVMLNDYVDITDVENKRNYVSVKTTFLCIASQFACTEFVVNLLLNGARTDLADGFKDTPLHKACRSSIKALQKVKILIEKDETQLTITNKSGSTPLHVAARRSDPSIIGHMLSFSTVDVNALSLKQLTPLHIACHFGCKQTAQMLLRATGSDVNIADVNGDTPLHHAASNGHNEVLQMLKDHPRYVPDLTNHAGLTADQENPINLKLQRKSQKGSVRAVQKLLDKGALCVPDKNGNTPLHKACLSDTQAFQKTLVLFKAKRKQVHMRNKYQTLPLHFAAKHKDKRILGFLMTKSQVNAQTPRHQNTALHLAVMFGRYKNVKVLLGIERLEINAQNAEGNTAAHLAAVKKQTKTLKLLQADPRHNPNIKNKKGRTVAEEHAESTNQLLHICYCGNIDAVKRILEGGVEFIKDEDENTVLHKACGSPMDALEKCILFVEKNAQFINMRNLKGNAPLHVACKRIDSKVTEYLLKQPDVDVNIRNKLDQTPLHISVIRRNVDNTRVLLQHSNIDIHCRDYALDTPCHIAATSKILPILELFQNRKDFNSQIRNGEGQTVRQIWSPLGTLANATGQIWQWHKGVTDETDVVWFGQLALIQGHLYRCLKDDGIRIYNQELEEVTTIAPSDIDQIYGVAECKDNELLVAADNGLFRITLASSTRKVISQEKVSEGFYTSIIRHNDMIYTARQDNSTSPWSTYIDKYDVNGSWRNAQSIQLPCPGAHVVTLHVTDTLIYVCCSQENKIYILSHDGNVESTQGRFGYVLGALNNPLLCHGDRNGALLVADRFNNRLQVLHANHDWELIEMRPQQLLSMPQSAVYTPGRLFVLSLERKKHHLTLLLPQT